MTNKREYDVVASRSPYDDPVRHTYDSPKKALKVAKRYVNKALTRSGGDTEDVSVIKDKKWLGKNRREIGNTDDDAMASVGPKGFAFR